MPTGRCLCEAVQYQVEGPFGEVRYCHCSQCRRGTGSAFSANAKVPSKSWRILAGDDLITEYEQKPGLFRAFCSRCGSPLYARLAREPEHIRVRLGGFEGQLDVTVTAHVWVSSKASWYTIEDSLPCYLEAIKDPRSV